MVPPPSPAWTWLPQAEIWKSPSQPSLAQPSMPGGGGGGLDGCGLGGFCVGGFDGCGFWGGGGGCGGDFSITIINLLKYSKFQHMVDIYLPDAKGDAGLIESLEGQQGHPQLVSYSEEKLLTNFCEFCSKLARSYV